MQFSCMNLLAFIQSFDKYIKLIIRHQIGIYFLEPVFNDVCPLKDLNSRGLKVYGHNCFMLFQLKSN